MIEAGLIAYMHLKCGIFDCSDYIFKGIVSRDGVSTEIIGV
jgi:hypothetical protein